MNTARTCTCENCGEVFESSWSAEEAFAEFKQNYPEEVNNPIAVICDDCYKKMRRWETRQRIKQLIKDFFHI